MPYPDEFKQKVVAAVRATGGYGIQTIAREFSVSHASVLRWALAAGMELPSMTERSAPGNREALTARWGGREKRRAKARKLHAQGTTLKQIMRACEYNSFASAYYAVHGEGRRRKRMQG